MKKAWLFCLALTVIGCSTMDQTQTAQSGPDPKDGGLSFPADHDTYPTFLKAVQKPKHVRDLFVNPTGAKTQKGDKFANGSVLVMKIYNAKLGSDGNAVKGSDGKNVKDNLAKVYVMEKGAGWGKNAPMGLKNGDWIYTAFSPDGKPLPNINYTTCRGCHLPLGESKDFVHRYDEYFDKRGH
jgi:hypothetical protein